MKANKETKKTLDTLEQMENLVASEGYKAAKRILIGKIVSLDSLSGIDKDAKSSDEIVSEMRAREGAIALVFEWLKEIEGQASQSKTTRELLSDAKRESMIVTIE